MAGSAVSSPTSTCTSMPSSEIIEDPARAADGEILADRNPRRPAGRGACLVQIEIDPQLAGVGIVPSRSEVAHRRLRQPAAGFDEKKS